MTSNLDALKARWKAFMIPWRAFAASTRGRRAIKGARALFALGIVAYLAYELTQIGWREVLASLPTNPLFYLLFLLLYFLLPTAEVVLYRITWRFDAWRSFPAFVKKRIYNKDVLQYSGEVYFYTWARRHVGLPDLKILETIRDQNIVSSVSSTMVSVLLLVAFLYTGRLNVVDLVGERGGTYLIGGGVVMLVLVILGVRLRKYLFSMALRTALLVLAVQCVRLFMGQAIQIAQWAVAMPEVPLRVWFTYAALSIIISRIPLIPNRDLIFMGAGVGLSGMMQVSAAGIAGMLGVIVVLGKVLNLAFFVALSVLDRRPQAWAAPTAGEAASVPAGPAPEPEEVAQRL